MFAKRLFKKAIHHHHQHAQPQDNSQQQGFNSDDLYLRTAVHYGIPQTASILAFDPIQRLLAIGTLDGRIKIIGGDNIESLLISPIKLPYKSLEFLCNQGLIIGISNDNDIQVWDLERRDLRCSLQWKLNITAFSVIHWTCLMYVGDEEGSLSVLKYDAEEEKIWPLPYHIPAKDLSEAAGISSHTLRSVVGILPQPGTSGNRILIAYDNGVMILWDISENRVVTVKGHSTLHLKDGESSDSLSRVLENQGNTSDNENEEKEICSICWASKSGYILAVGYIDGDILLWNFSSNSQIKGQKNKMAPSDVVKLQLSSGSRRLPVIVLHWSPDMKSNSECGGQLFVYGGGEIGSEEVLTVLNLDWPPGTETPNCISRLDLTLNGSFADMILIPKNGIDKHSSIDAVLVLTNPGQMHMYNGAELFNPKFQAEKSIKPENFHATIPTIDPQMTVSQICLVPADAPLPKALLKKTSGGTGAMVVLSGGIKWPLTGGILSELYFAEDHEIKRLFIAGYLDGSVRIWDASYPVFTLMYILKGEVKDIEMAGASSSVTAIDFCMANLTLAVGHESGLVLIYKIQERSDESIFHFLSESKHEVQKNAHLDGSIQLTTVLSVMKSPVQALQFSSCVERLYVGFKCGQVVILDLKSPAVISNKAHISGLNSVALSIKSTSISQTLSNDTRPSSPKKLEESEKELLFFLSRDAHIIVIDSDTGNMMNSKPMHPKRESTAISMHIIGNNNIAETFIMKNLGSKNLAEDASFERKPEESNQPGLVESGFKDHLLSETSRSEETLPDPLFLLCCEDALLLYSLNSVIQGDNNYIRKVNLVKPCCWSSTFKLKMDNGFGLILLYQTGTIEIRSLPDLEVLEEGSLMSILRWSFKANMEKTMSSSDNGQISMVNGCELAFISVLASENDFRVPESLPILHDRVLAAAGAAAIEHSSFHAKKQITTSRVFDGIIKGFKGTGTEQIGDASEIIPRTSFAQQLETFFSKSPFLDSSVALSEQEVVELNIDDIEIDDPVPIIPSVSHFDNHRKKGEKGEREKLFDGATVDTKPRLRTPEEILTKYKFGGDTAAAAAHARDKLAERQEKLQRISERTEELQNRAEDFKSMADELVKTMENRKWWKL